MWIFASGSNAEEYSKIENIQNTSVDNKKGYRIVTVTLKRFLFNSSKEIKEWLRCFTYEVWKVCVQQA